MVFVDVITFFEDIQKSALEAEDKYRPQGVFGQDMKYGLL